MINTYTVQKFRNLISDKQLENSEFSIDQSTLAVGKLVKITHKPFTYYFQFSEFVIDDKLRCEWSPDDVSDKGTITVLTIDEVLAVFDKWLQFLKQNLKAGGHLL